MNYIRLVIFCLTILAVSMTRGEYWGLSRERVPGLTQECWKGILEEFEMHHPDKCDFSLADKPLLPNTIPYIRVENGRASFPCVKWTVEDWTLEIPCKGIWTNSFDVANNNGRERFSFLELLCRITSDLHTKTGENVIICYPAFCLTWEGSFTLECKNGSGILLNDFLEFWESTGKWNQVGYCENQLRLDYNFGENTEWWFNE